MGVREDGSFFPGAEDIDNDPARALFANGNIGMKFAYSFDFAVLTSQFPASCDWGVAPLPVLDANASYKQIAIYDYGLVINSQAAETKDKELLVEVWKFFNSEELARLSYQEGINLPLDWNTIKDIDLPDEMRQWQDFAQLLEISAKYNKQPRQETGAEFDEQNEFLKKVWSGEETAVDYVKRFEEQLTLATQLYYEANPDEKLSDYNDADWDISR